MERAVELAELEGESGCTVALRMCDDDAPECPVRDLRASDIGNLLTVRGTVTRASGVRPLALGASFTCSKCGESAYQESRDGALSAPTVCPGDGCRSRTFTQHHESAKHSPLQRIRLQEVQEEQSSSRWSEPTLGPRGLPATVECELRDGLVGSCCPGELVYVRGTLRVLEADRAASGPAGRGRKAVDQRAFQMYIQAESLQNLSRTPGEANPSCTAPPGTRSFSAHDRALLHDLAAGHQGRVFQQLLHSLCPSLRGHEALKAGLVLSLFGGVQKEGAWGASADMTARSNIHVLILGDPGVGKSQLLRAIAAVSPCSTYVTGGGASSSGLTLSVAKDADLNGDAVLEAGALVLSDMGVCCVDEFDKMGAEYPALLEAMNYQRVSVAKTGLLASLPARAAIIAAANPVGGSYDPGRAVAENLRVSQALISNFDLIFVARDQPTDGASDSHFSRGPSKKARRREEGAAHAEEEAGAEGPFRQRLGLLPHEARDFEPLPAHVFQKYIAYARAHVFPQMTRGAGEVLRAYYEEARERAEMMEGAPVTVRLLECVVRLAEARARLELHEAVTEEDAEDAVDMLRECGVGSGGQDAAGEGAGHGARRPGGASKSQKKEKQRFLRLIQKMGKQEPGRLFDRQEFSQIADDMGLCVPDLDALIYELNEAGLILYKAGKYSVNQE